MPNYTGSAVYFSLPWVPRRPKSRQRSAKPSEPQRSRSRFRWRNAPKEPTQNIVARKRVQREDVDSDYHFGRSCISLPNYN